MPDPAADAWISDLRRLAGSEQRLRLLTILAEQDKPVYHREILEALHERGWTINPTAVSRMLRELEEAGYIAGDLDKQVRRGRTLHYTVNRAALSKLLTAALTALRANETAETSNG